MDSPRVISGLSDVAGGYDAVLCDVWGVIHNGRESFPRACAALAAFQRGRGPVVLVSNSPRPSDDVRAQLGALGVPDTAFAGFVTSGDVTRALLAARAPGPALAIGAERDATLYAGLGLALADVEDAAFISCTGLRDDAVETPHDYRGELARAAARGLVMICANPDRVVHRGAQLIFCAGALADLYRDLGGETVMAGKPFAPIYGEALALAARLRPGLERARVLAIGDGLPTDVKGAQDAGLDCLFVAGGIHAEALHGPDGGLEGGKVDALLAAARTRAAYAMATLAW